MEAAQTLKFNPWHARAEDLAQWAMLRLVNRTDRCGGYYVKDGQTQIYTAPRDAAKARVGYLSHARLLGHYRALETAQIVGVHAYGPDKHGKWSLIDIDNHDDAGDGMANERFAVHVARKAAALGLCVLLYESNGKGGFHLWLLFDGAVPAWVLKSLGGWLVSDHAEWGFEKPPEVFPKSDGGTEWGNWARLPGRHHTRDVWPRVWNGEQWVRDQDAVDFILGLNGCDSELIPSEALAFGLEVQTSAGSPRQDRPEGVVYAWEDFNQRATVDDVVEVLQRHQWTRDRSRADGAVEMIRPGKGRNGTQGGNVMRRSNGVVFFCFTDGASPLPPMKGFSPAVLAALLDHRGDFKASNTALYEKGFGTRTKPKAKAKPKAGQEGYQPDADAPTDDAESELVFAPVSGIVPEAVHYLVPGYVPRGMVGMIAGDGGHGKSMITLELAAALSSGRCAMGLVYPHPPKGKTLLISCEDDWQRTILPRLAALGADRANILRVEGVRMKRNGKTEVLDFHMGHYAQLERALLANPDIKLIVIDPAGAYIGRAGVNENQDAELRSVLGPLSEAANRSGATVLLIKHLNKSANATAVQRVGGGGAYVNAVRFSYMVAPDADEPEKKLMVPLKTNVLKAGLKGLAYRMADVPHAEGMAMLLREWPEMKQSDADELAKQLFRPQWEGSVDADANSLSGAKPKSGAASKNAVGECSEFLRKFLGQWSWPENEVEDASKKAGFSFYAMKQAKAQMRGDDKHDPARLSSAPVGSGGKWWLWIGSQYLRPLSRPDCQTGHTGETGQTAELNSSLIINKREEENTDTTITEDQSGSLAVSPGVYPPAHKTERLPDDDGPEPL